MPERFDVGTLEEFPSGGATIVRAGRYEVGVFNLEGRLYGLPNVCPHQQGPLCEGRVTGTLSRRAERDWKMEWIHDGELVICPWHLLEVHIPTGNCLGYRRGRIRTFNVVVEDGRVLVEV